MIINISLDALKAFLDACEDAEMLSESGVNVSLPPGGIAFLEWV